VIGAPGQLGQDVCRAYEDAEVMTADLRDAKAVLDIADFAAVRRVIVEEVRPDLVINTAAAHHLPQCEEQPALAYAVNATGARNLAIACQEAGVRLVHLSTDYVFGNGHSHPLDESAAIGPLSTYGASKAAGEYLIAAECENHVIVRTAALYGKAPCLAKGGRNFVGLMLHLAETQGEVRVVTDEVTTPTYTEVLARQIRLLAEKGRPGLYHVTCQGQCSWYEFAAAIFQRTNTPVILHPAVSADFPSPVRRPSYSVLSNKNLQSQGLDIMPPWEDALDGYLRATGRIVSVRS